MKITHNKCMGPVELVGRTVKTEPQDREWPLDKIAEVPYCTLCKTVVNVSELVNLP
jgi:hypothetical protein